MQDGTASASERRSLRASFAWRRIWLQVHLWLGLSVGLVLAVAGLTGAALVFAGPLTRAEVGYVVFPDVASGQHRPVSEWIAAAEKSYPELKPFESVHGPGAIPIPTGVPGLFKHVEDPVHGELHKFVAIDPVKGVPTGVVTAEDTWFGFILFLHMELTTGETGQTLVVWSTVLALASLATGLYLWWPKPGRWRQGFTVRAGAEGPALLRDLHNVTAIWLLLPLFVALFSGVFLVRGAWFEPALKAVSELRELQDFETASSPPGTCGPSSVAVDEAVKLARAASRDQDIRTIWLTGGERTAWHVELTNAGRNPKANGTVVWVDRNCPKVISVREGHSQTAAELTKSYMWPIHADLNFGLLGSAIVFLAGLALPCLFVTGLLLWWRRA